MDSNQFMNVQPAPAPQKKGSGKALFIIIGLAAGVVLTSLIACVVMMINSKKTPAKVEGAGYDSPEEAVEAYLNFLKEGDLDGAVSTFAVESCIDHYDMEKYLEWVQYVGITMPFAARQSPVLSYDSEFLRELNVESRRAYILNGICNQVISAAFMHSGEEEVVDRLVSRTMYELEDEDAVEHVLDFLETDPRLETIEIGDRLYEEDLLDSDDLLDTYIKHYKKIWDSDIEMVMYEVEIDGEDYILFMLCVCYDGKWYIADFNNPVSLALGSGPFKGLIPNLYFD